MNAKIGICSLTCMLVVLYSSSAFGQTPKLTGVSAATTGDTFITSNPLRVQLVGSTLVDNATIEFDTPNVMQSTKLSSTVSTSGVADFTLLTTADNTPNSIGVRVNNGAGVVSPYYKFTIVTKTDVCVEAVQNGVCKLRWEIESTGVTGNNGQTNNRTSPNILVTLDYLFKSPANHYVHEQVASARNATARDNFFQQHPNSKVSGTWTDSLSGRLDFETGFTQIVAANKVQPTTATTTSCPGNSAGSTSNTTCTIAAPQNAFLAQTAGSLGYAWGVDGQGSYADVGIGGRGSVEYLIAQNQIVQSNGLTYVSLSSLNPDDVVGFYEATGHFRLGQWGHDKTMSTDQAQNTSTLLLIEGGYRNDRGLQQLIGGSPQTNTRNRYVGRFYLYPELPNTKHTRVAIGMEYSGGMDGGPHVVQIFFGTNLNPSKLFSNQ
jgi:hypothetical protein